MKRCRAVLAAFCAGLATLSAQDDVRVTLLPRGVAAPDAERPPWTGERIPIDVRIAIADGIFRGRPALDLPDVEGTTLYRLDAPPTLGSVTEAGVTWITQTIELAAWVQRAGEITIPPIRVRFATAVNTIQAATPRVLDTEALVLRTERPPGTDGLPGPLLVSDDVSIEVSWSPPTGTLTPGDALRWSASLRAADVPAVLLPRLGPGFQQPPPDGLAVHPDPPQLDTRAPRGALQGSREDAFTLVAERPGRFELPAWTLRWWDPEAATLRKHEFDSSAFVVDAPASAASTSTATESEPSDVRLPAWLLALTAALVLALGWRLLRPLRGRLRDARRRAADREPGRFRALARACHRGDPRSIDHALQRWRAHPAVPPEATAQAQDRPEDLRRALESLGEAVGGGGGQDRFGGRKLLAALHQVRRSAHAGQRAATLPPLNPPGRD